MESHMPPSVVSPRNRQQAEDRDRRQHTEDWMRLPDVNMGEQAKRPLGLPAHPPPAYMVSADGILPPAAGPALPPLASIQSPFSDQNDQSPTSLPSFASLTASSLPSRGSPLMGAPSTSPPLRSEPWPSLNPLTAYYATNTTSTIASPERMDTEASRTVSALTSPRNVRSASVNMDDPDVRLAAEALGDLRADFVSSPPTRSTSRPISSPPETSESLQSTDREPLLTLLTTSHPLLATTIEGATSVYTSSKNFSPRFKSGAEYVEGYLTPIANTVGSVSRVTGVEGGVRWFLGGNNRRPHSSSSDLEAGRGNKRRKITAPSGSGPSTPAIQSGLASPAPVADPYAFTKDRRTSMSTVDTLPAYDDVRSPAYEATDEQSGDRTPTAERPSTASSSSAWQSRLIMSTSGLSIAMSEESLRSLKYCLQWLRWANDHIAGVVDTLKTTIDKYDVKPDTSEQFVTSSSTEASSEKQDQPDAATINASSDATVASPPQTSEAEVANSIAAMRNDVLKTLREVVETVSKYAGGALPENARILVRKHLTSLPQRFRLANQAEAGPSSSTNANGNGAGDGAQNEKGQHEKNKEIRDGAQRVMVLAKEGLDMMTQVSGVLDGTIVSAEEWCERLGKKKREQRETLLGGASNGEGSGVTPPEPAVLAGVTVDGDVKMG